MNALTENPFQPKQVATAVFVGLCALSAGAYAAPGAPGVPGGPGGQPPVTETGANNLSFPVILSDNLGPAGFPVDGAWRFAEITNIDTQCVDETEMLLTPGVPVPSEYVCYYGRHITVVAETGEIIPDGDPKVWWLQKRTQNFWKAMSIAHDTSDPESPLVVSAVDIGDLLESTPSIATRQIRVEFNLLKSVPPVGDEFSQYVVTDWSTPIPGPCIGVPDAANESIGCFAALGMSGAVPGTQQSGNEMQGTDFGPGGAVTNPGTTKLLDPTLVRTATFVDATGAEQAIPIHALVYSHCARLVIQKIAGTPVWDPATGQWTGEGVGAPVVNVATYSGTWATEITSGGSIVYGYNWNAKTVPTGTYRLTFVLDGNDEVGPRCSTTLGTRFQEPVDANNLGTQLVNVGENSTPNIVHAGDSALGDEGGLAYIDLTLTTKGGGKKGGR